MTRKMTIFESAEAINKLMTNGLNLSFPNSCTPGSEFEQIDIARSELRKAIPFWFRDMHVMIEEAKESTQIKKNLKQIIIWLFPELAELPEIIENLKKFDSVRSIVLGDGNEDD